MEIKQQLWEKAKVACLNAYAPYSNYQVGAAILAESNKIYASCNVENISFPCGTCAEAGAIAAMIAGGDRKIKEILIISQGKELVYPCGACLQRIAEFADEKTIIHLADMTEIRKMHHINNLLPCNFKATELKND